MIFQSRRAGMALLSALSVLLVCRLAPAAPPSAKKTPSAPISLGAVIQGVTVNLPDPKLPGKLLCELHAATAYGQSADNGFLGHMTHVSALLYQGGKPAATMIAPKTEGHSVHKTVTVTGTGGVIVKSLVQPGTRLTADTVVWYASINKVVATGHVFYRDGKSGATMTGAQAISDIKLKSVTILSGHASATL